MLTITPKLGRPRIDPIATLRIKLCGGQYSEPLKAVSHDGGRTWEIVQLHDLWRDAVLQAADVELLTHEASP